MTCWQAIPNLGFLPRRKPKGRPRYIRTGEDWLYLTLIMDLYDRKVIGWALSKSMKAVETTIPAWQMAIKNRPIERNLIFHPDRGVQYACHGFTKLLKKHPLVLQSMTGLPLQRKRQLLGQCCGGKLSLRRSDSKA